VSYARLAQQQVPTVLLGALSGATQVGIYKVGTAAAAIVARAADPVYAALLPRLSRLWGAGRVGDVRRLLARATLVAAPVMAVILAALIALRHPALELIGGSAARNAAVTVLVLAAIAQAVNGALFWNIGLLFAAGRAGGVAVVAVLGTLVQLGLVVPLALFFDANGAAAALLVSYTVTNAVATVLAIRALGWPRKPAPTSVHPTPTSLDARQAE
jgi:O-antigen/teichoic acid export membrane protein